MKKILLSIVLVIGIFEIATCSNPVKIDSDSLLHNIEKYNGKTVEIEGVIVHICGVDYEKMKLKTAEGSVIKIIQGKSEKSFDQELYKHKVKIIGIVEETRITKEEIDSLEHNKPILCHIDNSPCKDEEWINRQKEKGIADTISQRNFTKLRNIMTETSNDYVSVVTIIAESCEVIE